MSVLRIRDVYPGPDPNFFHPGSRVKKEDKREKMKKKKNVLKRNGEGGGEEA